jgi:hypothetical protein
MELTYSNYKFAAKNKTLKKIMEWWSREVAMMQL